MAKKFRIPVKREGLFGGQGFLSKSKGQQIRLVDKAIRKTDLKTARGGLIALKVRTKNTCPSCGRKVDNLLQHISRYHA